MKKHIHALMIPVLVGLGLAAGLLREVFLAYLFGTSREIEIFRVAFGLPSILSEALAISFVSVLIPIFLAGQDIARLRLAIWGTGVLACAVFLLGMITMPWQAQILAPGIIGKDRDALIVAGVICWGMFFLAIFSLPLRASMSVKKIVWPAASATLLRSIGFVVALGALLVLQEPAAETAAWAALIAGAVVLVAHLIAFGRVERKSLVAAVCKGPPLNELGPLLKALLLVFGTQLLLSGGRIVDRAVASGMADGTLAAIEYSYSLLMAIAALMGTSANIFLAPRIGHSVKETGKIAAHYWKVITVITLLAVISGVVLAAVATPIVRIVFEYGAFGPDDTALTVKVVRLHALALGPLVLALLLTQVLILSGWQKYLIPIAVSKLIIKVMSLWLLVGFGFGLEGIALSLGLAEVVVACILMYGLKRLSLMRMTKQA